MNYILEKLKTSCLEFLSIGFKNNFDTGGKLKMCCICPGSEEYEHTVGCWKWKVV